MSWAWPLGGAAGVAAGWHAYALPADARPGLLDGPVVELPPWPAEIALSVEMPGPQPPARPAWLNGHGGAASRWQPKGDRLGLELPERSVLLALRAGGLAWPLLDRLGGTAVLGRVAEGRAVSLPQPAQLPGLVPVGAERVRRHLTLAGTRGVADRDPGASEVAGAVLGSRGGWHGRAYGLHPGGRAARHTRTRGGEVRWEVGSGADVRAAGPFGRSVQAIVTLHGNGEPELLLPPPGGALVLRAWRDGDEWQVLCAVVVAAGAGISAGRIAGRLARLAITRSWDAAALTGHAAVTVARAGDPRHRLPTRIARPLPAAAFQTLLAGCLQIACDSASDAPAPPPPTAAMTAAGSLLTTGSGAEPAAAQATPPPDSGPSTLTGLPRLLEDLAARPLPSPQPEEPEDSLSTPHPLTRYRPAADPEQDGTPPPTASP